MLSKILHFIYFSWLTSWQWYKVIKPPISRASQQLNKLSTCFGSTRIVIRNNCSIISNLYFRPVSKSLSNAGCDFDTFTGSPKRWICQPARLSACLAKQQNNANTRHIKWEQHRMGQFRSAALLVWKKGTFRWCYTRLALQRSNTSIWLFALHRSHFAYDTYNHGKSGCEEYVSVCCSC